LETALNDVVIGHYTSESECDICGYHTHCDKCGDVSRSHQAEKVIEAALEWQREHWGP
jgi:hypothetical protein